MKSKEINIYINDNDSVESFKQKVIAYKDKVINITWIKHNYEKENILTDSIGDLNLIAFLFISITQAKLLSSRLSFENFEDIFNHYFDNLSRENQITAANNFLSSFFDRYSILYHVSQTNYVQYFEHNKVVNKMFDKIFKTTTQVVTNGSCDPLICLLAKKDNYLRMNDSLKKIILNHEEIKKSVSHKSNLDYDCIDIALFSENKDFLFYCVNNDLIPFEKLVEVERYQIKEKGFLSDVISIMEKRKLNQIIIAEDKTINKKVINKL